MSRRCIRATIFASSARNACRSPRPEPRRIWLSATAWAASGAWAFERYENALVRRLSAVVAATPHIAQRFAAVQSRSVSVCNFPSLDELSLPTGDARRENAVCYVGGITRTRGIRELVRAIELL